MASRKKSLFDGVNLAWVIVFFASAAVQYNDPDPLPWIVIYAAAGAACLVFRMTRPSWLVPALVGLAALLWAALAAPRVLPDLHFTDLFRSMKAETPSIEQGRELLGLLLITFWMTVLAIHGSQKSRSQVKT